MNVVKDKHRFQKKKRKLHYLFLSLSIIKILDDK